MNRYWLLPVIGVALNCAAEMVSLNGEWQLDYWDERPEQPVRSPAQVPAEAKRIRATVPGNCELDAMRAGLLPQLEVGMNVRNLRPWEGKGWRYTRDFEWKGSGRARIRFGGVDTLADYYLNGKKIGESANMLIPHAFEVTDAIKAGKNRLEVFIRSAFYEAQRHSVGQLGYQMGFADNEPLRKAAYMGGWDIFPRAYVSGIWRSVTVEEIPEVEIDNVAWMSGNFAPDFKACSIKAHFRVKGPITAFDWGCKARLTFGDIVEEREYVAVQNAMSFRLENPRLWWPKGMGEHYLYDAKIEIVDKAGKVLASDTRKFGVRLVQLERDDIYGKDRPGQFLFRVNGEKCYVRGSNWVPLDSFPSRHDERMVPTLEMFEDLNCNMVRVWGGGVYESEKFFDWCDRHGLMIWQDFMTGCAVFPQTDEYAKATEEEIRSVVTEFRNHASLVMWSGNNENDCAIDWGTCREFRRNPNDDRNSRKTIPDVLWDYDITRPYLPSSPFISPDVRAGKAKPSEEHLWGARAYYKVPFYTNAPCWFASEMGYHGCPGRKSLERMMTKDAVYPWKPGTYDWNDEWRLKASNPYMHGSQYLWRRNDLMTNQVTIMFGSVSKDLDTFIAQSQFVQTEAMKTFCELFRAGKFDRKNGLIWWNVRDGWPQISDAVVDYYGEKKSAYYALRNAQQNQIVCVTDDHKVWAVNDDLREVTGKARLTDAATGKVLIDKTFTIPRNGKLCVGEVDFAGQGVVLIEADFEGMKFRNHYLYGKPPFNWENIKKIKETRTY